jgi:LacI family transcriptional regulator
VEELLSSGDPPTALFTAQDLITMTAVSVLQRRGLADQVALVGFDDFELADLLQPGVTVIAQDPRRIGALAAELALDPESSGVHLVPTRLVARGSGEIPAG